MWLDLYNGLTNAEKERFSKATNYILNKNFVTREIYESQDKVGKINADYRFIEKYFELFEGYLGIMNFDLKKNDAYGFFFLENVYGYNKERLDKLTTLILFTLRNIFDEEKEKNNIGSVVYLNTASLIYKLLELKVVSKRPTMKDIVQILRFLINQNIITKIEGSIETSECLIAILPTIIQVVSNEKIDAIYTMLFENSDENDDESSSQTSYEVDEELEEVFSL